MIRNNYFKIMFFTFISMFLLLTTVQINAEQSDIIFGEWEGLIFLEDKRVYIEVTFDKKDEDINGTINIPSQEISDQPLKIKEINDSEVVFEIKNVSDNLIFKGNYDKDKIEGWYSQNGNNNYNFIVKNNTKNNENVLNLTGSEQEVEIPVKDGFLSASLTYPKIHDIKDPVAILIPESGPIDRDGNKPLGEQQINNLKNISYSLANNDIISIRYDKRGVGKSSGLVKSKTPTFTQYRNDILKIIDYIKNNLGRKSQNIFLVGHGEGSTLAIMAAHKVENLAGLVLLAGPGFKQEVLLRRQLKKQNEILYKDDEIEDEQLLVRVLDKLIDAIENDDDFDLSRYNVPDDFKSIYRSLNKQRDFSKEWLNTSPSELLEDVNLPTCIVQGENDQQVSKEDAERLSTGVSKKNLTLKYIKGVDHILLEDNDEISPKVLNTINKFISKNK